MALLVVLVFLDCGDVEVVVPEIDVEEGEITVLKGILLTAVMGMAFNPLIWIGMAPGGIVLPAKIRRLAVLPEVAPPAPLPISLNIFLFLE